MIKAIGTSGSMLITQGAIQSDVGELVEYS